MAPLLQCRPCPGRVCTSPNLILSSTFTFSKAGSRAHFSQWNASSPYASNRPNVAARRNFAEPPFQLWPPTSRRHLAKPLRTWTLAAVTNARPDNTNVLNADSPRLRPRLFSLAPNSPLRPQPPRLYLNTTAATCGQTSLNDPAAINSTRLQPSQSSPQAYINPRIPYSRPRVNSFLIPIMTSSTQKRSHGGHHHHHHHHDNVYLTSQNKNDAGVRITRIGLFSNLGMAIAKGAGGYLFNSQAMVADAIHSVTDLASDVLTLATISWSLRPPTDKFPLGFGKIESLGALGVSGMLLFGGLWMGYGSLLTLYGHFFLDPTAAAELMAHAHSHGHSHSHGHDAHVTPSLHAAWLAAGTVAIKEWLYQATMKVARERQSSVLASNAIHHRIDSLTGIVTLAAILGANLMQNATWLDPVGGLLISLMVVKAGVENTISALFELADRSVDEEVQESTRKHARKALEDINEGHDVEVRDVSGVKSGQNYLIDVEVAVPSAWTMSNTKDIEDKIRTRVGAKVRGARRVRVRFVLKEAPVAPKFDEFIAGDVSQQANPEEEDDSHDHEHDHGHGNGNHHKSQ